MLVLDENSQYTEIKKKRKKKKNTFIRKKK